MKTALRRLASGIVALALAGCASTIPTTELPFKEWLKDFIAPTELAGQPYESSVVDLADEELLGGDSLSLPWAQGAPSVLELSSYFVDRDVRPFEDARVSSVEYLYCSTSFPGGVTQLRQYWTEKAELETDPDSLNLERKDSPYHGVVLYNGPQPVRRKMPPPELVELPPTLSEHLCGLYVFYHSEERGSEERGSEETALAPRDPALAQTTHEKIIDVLKRRHRKPQFQSLQGQTFITLADGAVEPGPTTGYYQRREWCRAQHRRLPEDCPMTIVAWFNAYYGFGGVLYAGRALYAFADFYRERTGFDHPVAMLLKQRVKLISHDEALKRLESYVPSTDHELITEQVLGHAQRQGRSRTRARHARLLETREFGQELYTVSLYLKRKYIPPLERAYWGGYRTGLIERQFMQAFTIGDEQDKKWSAAALATDELWHARGVGYLHGLRGTPEPPSVAGGRCMAFAGLKRLQCFFGGYNENLPSPSKDDGSRLPDR